MPAANDVPSPSRRPVLTPLPFEGAGEGDLGLVDALAQLTFVVQGALSRIAAEHDVSIPAARLLGIVRDRQPTIGELATFLQLDKSSVTGLVDRAAERGLVVRAASTVDRRSVRVVITALGRELIDQGAAELEAEIALLVADLTAAQRSRLSALASRVVAADARRRGIDLHATLDGEPTNLTAP